MISNKAQFLSFNDGIAEIYSVTNGALPGDKPKEILTLIEKLRFKDNTVGMSRFYEAMQAKINISRVIQLPLIALITTADVVKIGETEYKIVQKQEYWETRPPSMKLTLSDRKARL